MRSWPVLLLVFASPLLAAETKPGAAEIEFFENKIRPVLVEQCLSCHGEKKQSGGLRLDRKSAILKGGDNGPALVPGKAEASLLVKAIRQVGELKMPQKGKLSPSVIADFEKWINSGAADPRDDSAATIEIDWKKAREFWSFKPVVKPAIPAGNEPNPIDRFIRLKLEEKGLKAVPLADKRTLIRRVTFDLTGLPPTPAEVETFVKDESVDAYAKLVDRLLATQTYGEMQARQWLDVARYAEDQAHTFAVKPYGDAWRYRDWVIRAFNEDLPFEKFVKYQIAADLIVGDSPEEIQHRAAPDDGRLGTAPSPDPASGTNIMVGGRVGSRNSSAFRGQRTGIRRQKTEDRRQIFVCRCAARLLKARLRRDNTSVFCPLSSVF